MATWDKVKLGEIASITSSKRIFAKEYQTEGIPFYRGKEIIGKHNGNDVSTELYITRERYEEIKAKFDVPKPGDILLSSVGTLGVSWLVDEEEFYFKDGNLTWLRCNEKTTSEFLYLWLNSPEAQNQIDAMCIGSTQKALTIETLNKFDVTLPPLDLQKKICEMVYPISDKIKNNTAINRNLSEQAQALYKSWFVDLNPFEGERPADWQDGTVDDLASEVVCGKTPSTKKEEYYGNDIPFVTIPDMHGCVYTIHTERSLSELGAESQSKKTLPKNSICVSCIGTAGLVTLLPVPSQTNQQINSIIPKDNYSPYYIYLLMSTMRETINKLGQAGSTIVNLNKTQFGKIEVLIPSIKTMSDFDEIVEPVFSAILSNQIENEKLANLRDSLLPKLMSGEIDVSDLEI